MDLSPLYSASRASDNRFRPVRPPRETTINDGIDIRELVRRVRRRFFFNIAVAQAVVAASVAMAGVILILVLGSQLLDWRWPALLAVVTFPLAFYRTARRGPSSYRVAQIVDDRLDLRDSLSTPRFFTQPGGPRISQSVAQGHTAER